MKNLLSTLFNLLYENNCSICHKSTDEQSVCENCENCFVQRNPHSPKLLENISVYSWGLYDGELRDGILNLKNGKKKLGVYFSKKLIALWKNLPEEVKAPKCTVIPIPSHKRRIKERGFCQTSIIAKEFALKLNFDFCNNFIVRTKETQFMNKLSNIHERIENIKDAFSLTSIPLVNKNLLLIDDILTSGSTMTEISRTIHFRYKKDIKLIGLTVASGDVYN